MRKFFAKGLGMKRITFSIIAVGLLCSGMEIYMHNETIALAGEIQVDTRQIDTRQIDEAAIESGIAERGHEEKEILLLESTKDVQQQEDAMPQETVAASLKSQKREENQNTSQSKSQKQTVPISGTFKANITYYCACNICNGSYAWQDEDGIWCCTTAKGIILSNNGEDWFVCAANFGNLGNKIEIDGEVYTIVDRFGNNGGSPKIDIFCADGHARCNQLGRRTDVFVTLLD